MRNARVLAVNLKILLHNRLMMWMTACFVVMMAPLALLSAFSRSGPSDSGMVWSLFFMQVMAGYFVAFLELSVLSRPFSFTLPGHSEIPGQLLILIAILLNSTTALFFWPPHITGSTVLSLFSLFMLGNACFLAPAVVSTFLKSARTFVSYVFPALFLLSIYGRGMKPQMVLSPEVAIPLGLLAWIFVWTRFRDRNVQRSLVGRTDFDIGSSWLNQDKYKKAWEKASIEKRQGISLAESFSERVFVREMANSEEREEGKGLAGVFYSVLGRFNYRTALRGLAAIVFFGLYFRFIGNAYTTTLFTHNQFALFVVIYTYSLLVPTALPKHFYQLPLSRKAKAKVAIYWNIFRTVSATVVIFTGLALVTFLIPAAHADKLLTLAIIPLYAAPLLMIAELFSSSPGIVFLVLPLLVFWPSPLLLLSALIVRLTILFVLWGLLSVAIVWRFRSFDLSGSMDAWKQAWSKGSIRTIVILGIGLCVVFSFTRSPWHSLTLDRRLVADSDGTRETAIHEFMGLPPDEKERHIDRLIDVLHRDVYPDRFLAVYTLRNIGWRAHRTLPMLIDTLKVNHRDLQWNILHTLGDWGPAARPAAPAVYPFLKNENKYARVMAARALIAMKVPDADRADILNELTASLEYNGQYEVQKAIETLAVLGSVAKPALPALLNAAANSSDSKTRRDAVWALGRIGSNNKDLIAALIRYARDPDTNIELNALLSLAWVAPETLKSVPEISGTLGQFKTQRRLDDAILYSANEGDVKDVEAILDLGANINTKGFYTGETPLMIAVNEGHVDVVRLLLDRGADISIRNDAQETDINVAEPYLDKGLFGLGEYWFADRIGIRKLLSSYEGKTAMVYALQADLPEDRRAEIIKLLKGSISVDNNVRNQRIQS